MKNLPVVSGKDLIFEKIRVLGGTAERRPCSVEI